MKRPHPRAEAAGDGAARYELSVRRDLELRAPPTLRRPSQPQQHWDFHQPEDD
jgi:hypothetical protein